METSFETVESAYEQKGFVKGDTVRTYKEDVDVSYPHLVLACDQFEGYRAKALKGLVKQESMIPNPTDYTVYIKLQGQMVRAGVIAEDSLRVLIMDKAYANFEKYAMLDASTLIEGTLLQALCPSVGM